MIGWNGMVSIEILGTFCVGSALGGSITVFSILLQAVWMVTWLSVVVLSVDFGLAVGVVFSMMTVVCRTQR